MFRRLVSQRETESTVSARSKGASYVDQVLADIKRYEPGDRQELLAFRSAMYGGSSGRSDERYVHWLYEDPTYASSGYTPLWVYKKNGRVGGQQGAIRVALKIGREYRDALWTIDLMVTPPLRLRGVGAVLNEVAYREVGLSLGVEVSEAARKAFLRAGWIDTGTVPLYVRPLNTSEFLGNRWRSTRGRIVGSGANIALRAAELLGWTGTALAGLRMEEVRAFDERIDQLWERVAPAYPVISRRDCRYLNWRFVRYPEPGRYRILLFHEGRTLVGYAVVRQGQHHGLPAGHIVDFLCGPHWAYSILARCITFFRRQGMQVVSCVHHNPSLLARAAFTAHGFARRDSGWPLMLRARDLSPEALALVSDQSNWFVTGADSDLDRPREGTVYAPDQAGMAVGTS